MTNYKIITDFCSDLTLEMAEKLDAEIVPMEVVIDGEEPVSGFDIDISDFYTKLREKSILVRHFTAPRICEYNRITIGTREQMKKLICAVKEILEETK